MHEQRASSTATATSTTVAKTQFALLNFGHFLRVSKHRRPLLAKSPSDRSGKTANCVHVRAKQSSSFKWFVENQRTK